MNDSLLVDGKDSNGFSKLSYTGPPSDLGQYLWSILDDILFSKVLASVFGLWHLKLIFGIFFSFRHSIFIRRVSSYLGAKYLVFFLLSFPQNEWKILVLLSFEGSVFTFQFLNDKIHNYVKKTKLWILSSKSL